MIVRALVGDSTMTRCLPEAALAAEAPLPLEPEARLFHVAPDFFLVDDLAVLAVLLVLRDVFFLAMPVSVSSAEGEADQYGIVRISWRRVATDARCTWRST